MLTRACSKHVHATHVPHYLHVGSDVTYSKLEIILEQYHMLSSETGSPDQ